MPRGCFPHLSLRGPRGHKALRPCVVCGLAPGNDAAPVLNLSASCRGYGHSRILNMSLSLCARCLLEAAKDGRVSNLDGLRASLDGLRALRGTPTA